MQRQGDIDTSSIGIVVRGGEVILCGSVASERERSMVGQIAAKITARTAVINHIQVFRTTQS